MAEDISAEFIGVCHGITADGWVSAEEIYFLGKWLNEHPDALKVWPGREFVEPLNRFFADGVLDAGELEEAIALLTRVEMEWGLRRGASVPVAEAKTASAGRGKTRKTETATTIPELFDWSLIALPSVDWQGEVLSFSGLDSYLIDLREPRCDCQDWQDRRAGLPANHPAKACKHIVSVLCRQSEEGMVAVQPLLQFILSNARSHGIGIFPANTYGSFELNGAKILFSFGAPPWMNVWAPDGEIYGRYGYSHEEERWSYGVKPKNAQAILQAIDRAKTTKAVVPMAENLSTRSPVASEITPREHSFSANREPTTERQTRFLTELGFPPAAHSDYNLELLLLRVLRPIDFALKSSFKNLEVLTVEELRTLQKAIAHAPYLATLPRYGPRSTWDELDASGVDHRRRLTNDEKMLVTDTAYKALPPGTFLALKSNGIKKYKMQLDILLV